MCIGIVVEVFVNVIINGKLVYFRVDNIVVLVLIKIEYGRFYYDNVVVREFW